MLALRGVLGAAACGAGGCQQGCWRYVGCSERPRAERGVPAGMLALRGVRAAARGLGSGANGERESEAR